MTQNDKAKHFHALHQKDRPLILYNIWDVMTAQLAESAGASALATGSWSVAVSQGYEDGESLPFTYLLNLASRLVAQTDLPVSIDFECGYAASNELLIENFRHLIQAGIIGINFEDQNLSTGGLVPHQTQAERIAALVAIGAELGVDVFINARTDIFLQDADPSRHAALLEQATERGHAYMEAGASGFFVPGLTQPDLIQELCSRVTLPLNVMWSGLDMTVTELSALGVKRISYGPQPLRVLKAQFLENARRVYAGD